MTILIVDDNEPNLYQLQVLLGASGYQVVTAANGAQALTTARQNPPDLIISDILMPVMDGFTLCDQWKKDQRLRQIPFVFYTATYTDERDREFALSLGAEQFLVKPEEPEAFVRIIREVTQQVQHRPPAPAAKKTPAHLPGEERPKEKSIDLKQYNEVLIRKLEAKMQQLEAANRALELDITERKRVEKTLQDEKAFTESIIDSLPDAFYVTDSKGRFVRWNKNVEDILGYSSKELAALKTLGYVAEDERPLVATMMQRALAKGSAAAEVHVLTKDGRKIPYILMAKRALIADEVYLVGIGIDIAERKRAEEAKAYLASIVESSDDAIIGKSPEGIIESWNAGAEKLYGYTAMEVIGQSVLILVPPERQEEVADFLNRIKQGKKINHHETVRVKKDGGRVDVSVTISPVKNVTGEIIGASTIEQEVTERKILEEHVRQAAKMKRSVG